jgi:hypothetical protein
MYVCNGNDGQDDSSSGTVPPSNLNVGDLWGGGVVTYIAQPNDLLYVEGEIHGLIAPVHFFNIGGGPWKDWLAWPLSGSPNYQDYRAQAEWRIGGGLVNQQLHASFWNPDPNDYTSSHGFCTNATINGYDDWFLPNAAELSTLFTLHEYIDSLPFDDIDPIVHDYCQDLEHGYMKGLWIHSGGLFPSVGVLVGALIPPGNNGGCSSSGCERTLPMRAF